MASLFDEVSKLADQAKQKIQEVSKNLLVEKLVPQLEKLERAEMLSIVPIVYQPLCSCSQGPQYFYRLLVGEQLIGHIMHGRQGPLDASCSKCITSQCSKFCGPACFKDCQKFMKECSKCCKCFVECITCKPLGACCRRLGSYVQYVQQFEDYENAIEVRHTITPLGWGYSEKDGLYIDRNEYAIGAFYETTPEQTTDWVAQYQARSVVTTAAEQMGVDQSEIKDLQKKSGKALDLANPPGIPKIEDEVWEDVSQVYACLRCQSKEEYLKHYEWQDPFMQTYGIHYLGKYIGRYIYGYLFKDILWCLCGVSIAPAYFGFVYRDDVYLLDNFDNLLYRMTMKELSYYEAINDASTGTLYCLSILDPQNNPVAQIIKRKMSRCCGLHSVWSFDMNFPRNATPIQKLLLTYAIPFLNEKYMNIFSPDTSHELEDIKHDRQWAEMQKGTQQVLFDRLVDQMSYKNVEGVEVLKVLTTIAATNPSRKEGQAIRYNSYKNSGALQREYVRRKKIEAKAVILQQVLENELQQIQEYREGVKH